MAEPTTYVFDFDSTLVRIETLEALADIALAGVPDAAAIRAEVAALTDQAMTGDLPFGEALNRRLALLPLTRDHVAELAARILDEGTPSVRRNLRFFREHAGRIVILSGGFREIIAPSPPISTSRRNRCSAMTCSMTPKGGSRAWIRPTPCHRPAASRSSSMRWACRAPWS